MAASDVFMHYSGVTFTYTGPTVVTINQVTEITENFGGTKVGFSADFSPGETHIAEVGIMREATIQGANLKRFYDIPVNTTGTLVYTRRDMMSGVGASSGAITITLSQARKTGGPTAGGPHNTPQGGGVTFSAMWTFAGGVYVDPLGAVQA